jgi:hypothetical protein
MQYTFKSEVVYEVENDEAGLIAQVITWPNIMWKYRVILHDVDAGERVGIHKSFKHLGDAEAYADTCVEYS